MLKISSLLLLVLCAAILRKTNAMSEEEHKQIHEMMTPIVAECSEQHSTNPEDLVAAKQSKDISGVDSCLIECIFKKMGVMDDEGVFVPEKYAENMKKILKKEGDSAKIEESAKNCASVNDAASEDKCAKSKALLTCLMEQKELLGM